MDKMPGPAELWSSCPGLSLENRILAECPSALCTPKSGLSQGLNCASPSWARKPASSSLQPTWLSSTTSTSLPLSPSVLSKTQNLLSVKSPSHLPLSSSVLQSRGDVKGLLLPVPLKELPVEAAVDEEEDNGVDLLSSCDDLQCSSEVYSQVTDEMSTEKPALDVDEPEEEEELPGVYEDCFGELIEDGDWQEEDLKNLKYLLLNVVCSSLVNKTKSPGDEGWDKENSVWTKIKTTADELSESDPQFILKVAVYTRQELNIRITANFLLALAAHLPATKPHLRRYFCKAVQLPSDWLEVTRIYSTCFSKSLPSCLKKALVDKFKQFSEYQLAKYNTRKQRCKHSRVKTSAKQPSHEQWKVWASKLRSDPVMLQKYLKTHERKAVDKKANVFNLKKMIQRLHIHEPAEYVMALLGKRYPRDHQEFLRCGLRGNWDQERAGSRMKLTQPDTWERKLSREGNRARTWEELIDSKALPFMAMLRNLKNMISRGISERHHQKILNRLTNKESVIKSKQFPFRFLAAYKVITDLRVSVKIPPNSKLLCGILEKVPKSKKFKKLDWQTAGRQRMRVALGVPFVYRVFQMKKKQLKLASQKLYTEELLDRYQQALETAVQISCHHNVPPLPGRTVLFLDSNISTDSRWSERLDFCCPAGAKGEKEGSEPVGTSAQEVAVLLALMIARCSENIQLYISSYLGIKEVELKSDVVLENVRHVMEQLEEFWNVVDPESHSKFLFNLRAHNTKIDTMICFDDCYHLEMAVGHYRKAMNNEPLLINIFLNNSFSEEESPKTVDRNYVQLHGFSDQILKFIAERGSARLLDHVEHIDKLYNVPPLGDSKFQIQEAPAALPFPAIPQLRWREIRIFVSSTFRDMHGERDVLVRSVFPELRRRAAPFGLRLQEVDLRWGVTEEEAGRTTELCLSEVCRSQLLLGILGERYGLVPSCPALPDLPQYCWLKSAPPGLSMTEMEIRQFEALYPESAHDRMMFFFRSPHMSRSVPVGWRSDFVAESKDAEMKMTNLKSRLLSSGVRVTKDYACEWGGVENGKPYLKGLEEFRRAVTEELWEALLRFFVKDVDKSGSVSELTEQEFYQDAQQQQCHGRGKLIATAMEKVKELQSKGSGGLVLVQGGPGYGKTVFMAALANALRTHESKGTSGYDVISYFTAASQSAHSVEHLMRCLVRWLRKRLEMDEEMPVPSTYKDLLAEFHSQISALKNVKKKKQFAIVIDGADLVHDARGDLVTDWIPHCLPGGVCLVLSVTSNSVLQQTLAKKKSSILLSVGQLLLPDRKEVVQKELAMYGKKLSDSAFNNQLQTLLMKKGAVSPLYLHLACEELRSFAVFDKMKESLQSLPESVTELVEYCLRRLESQYAGVGLSWVLGALAVSNRGLREGDLYSLLNMWSELSTGSGQVTWKDMLLRARMPQGRLPMAVFSQLFRSLQSLIGQSCCQDPDSRLALSNPEVRLAFENLFLSNEVDRSRAHGLLAVHLWVLSDPQGKNTFLHCDPDAILDLPLHLVSGGQWAALRSLLSSFDFLHAHVRHGLLHHLLNTYRLFEEADRESEAGTRQDDFECSDSEVFSPGSLDECHAFLQCHAPILTHWPALFLQQALNEPTGSSAHTWARGALEGGCRRVPKGMRVLRWENTMTHASKDASKLVSTFLSNPTCVALSPTGRVIAVGTGQGYILLVDSETSQEIKSFVSNCDGISGCVFLEEGNLCSTSFDGQMEMWDVESGCRTTQVDAHSNRITGIALSPDRKNVASVSLDLNLKIWVSPNSKLVCTLPNPCPLNCVTFHPEGQLLAVGCWDGSVRLWNWLRGEMAATLPGHQQSVRSLSFSPSSPLLSSGSVSGEVRLWSIAASACVGCYQAHGGSVEALGFVQDGQLLLSAGSDSLVQLWSGGLGHCVGQFAEQLACSDSSITSENPALCVATAGDYAAVGYHSSGLKLFLVESGERLWASEHLRAPVQCLEWIRTEGEAELLASGGGDKCLSVWRRTEDRLDLQVRFGKQQGGIVAMAQSPTYLASASEDFTIALWSVQDLVSNPSGDPSLVVLLRGHSGGVTCLSFSSCGSKLLSGGKDQSLLVWDVSVSPPVLSQSLRHCHRDWITGCSWATDHAVTCSVDCKVHLWDLATGNAVGEFAGGTSLTSVCSVGGYIIAGSVGGELLVWNWKSKVEITRVHAHHSRICQCIPLSHIDSDKSQETQKGDVVVATASEDGTVKLWHPLQVHHHSTLTGHSGGIRGTAARQEVVPALLTVSEDRSLRSWGIDAEAESSPKSRGRVTALCISPCGLLVLLGSTSGVVEMWCNNSLLCSKQVTDHVVIALTFMSDEQFAVSSGDFMVAVWKLDWNQQRTATSFCEVSSSKWNSPALFLLPLNSLLGLCDNGDVVYHSNSESHRSWTNCNRFLGVQENDEKSRWILGMSDDEIVLGFTFCAGPSHCQQNSSPAFCCLSMDAEEKSGDPAGQFKKAFVSAAALDRDLVVCGDSTGNIWFSVPPAVSSWSKKKVAHGDRVSVLRVTESTIISASFDRTVKLWDRQSKKQVGLFVCQGPVTCLEVNPCRPTELVCGDSHGQVYYLSWTE